MLVGAAERPPQLSRPSADARLGSRYMASRSASAAELSGPPFADWSAPSRGTGTLRTSCLSRHCRTPARVTANWASRTIPVAFDSASRVLAARASAAASADRASVSASLPAEGVQLFGDLLRRPEQGQRKHHPRRALR